jgi:hypothetical protein
MSRLSWSALVDAVRHVHGPRARIKRIERAGLPGLQVLDGDGGVLLQTFNAPTPIDALRELTRAA